MSQYVIKINDMKPLTLKEIKKRHTKNPQDIELHKTIETKTIDRKIFNELIKEGTKHESFDKKNKSEI